MDVNVVNLTDRYLCTPMLFSPLTHLAGIQPQSHYFPLPMILGQCQTMKAFRCITKIDKKYMLPSVMHNTLDMARTLCTEMLS